MPWENRDPRRAPMPTGSPELRVFNAVEAAAARIEQWSEDQRTGKACIICGCKLTNRADKERAEDEYAPPTRPGDLFYRCKDRPNCIKRMYEAMRANP